MRIEVGSVGGGLDRGRDDTMSGVCPTSSAKGVKSSKTKDCGNNTKLKSAGEKTRQVRPRFEEVQELTFGGTRKQVSRTG